MRSGLVPLTLLLLTLLAPAASTGIDQAIDPSTPGVYLLVKVNGESLPSVSGTKTAEGRHCKDEALGGDAISVDAMYFACSEPSPLWKDLLYRAAGSLFNVLVAIASIVALGRISNPRSWLGYFLWISAILNLLQSGSYVGFGRFIHPGMDWAMIVAVAPPNAP